jgi:hypothetical protein
MLRFPLVLPFLTSMPAMPIIAPVIVRAVTQRLIYALLYPALTGRIVGVSVIALCHDRATHVR